MTNESKNWQKVREDAELEELLSNEEELDEEASEGSEAEPEQSLGHLSYEELEDKLTRAEQKAHENWEKSVRAVAELDNVRKRAERDVQNAHKYGLERFVDSLIPVLDSLGAALDLAKDHSEKAMVEGLELTMKQFTDSLQKHGVEEINPEGEAFNPEFHEAMSMQEAEGAKPNSVLAVFQKGYKLNDRVIRPARVIVAKG